MARQGVDPNPNRDLILKVIASSSKAVTPKFILTAARKTRSIDKVTLYRILDLFVARRILRRMASVAGSLRYEIACAEHNPLHPHFVCRECGDMECLSDVDLSDVRERLNMKTKNLPEDIDLKLEGVCQKCSPRKRRRHEEK